MGERHNYKNSPRITKSLRCSNVRVGGWNSFTIRNSLWPTTHLPTMKTRKQTKCQKNETEDILSKHLCDGFKRALSAYMLFNDEDDGFRITWIAAHSNTTDLGSYSQTPRPRAIRPARKDIVIKSDENVWEVCHSDPETGHIHQEYCKEYGDDHSGLIIAYEVYLRVDALLSDILSRRQSSLFKTSKQSDNNDHAGRMMIMADFFYNLVSVSQDLCVTMVIVFSNPAMSSQSTKKIPSALGIIVNFSIWDQSYDEVKWVQHPSRTGKSGMKKWCKELALNWRMKDCGVGVFCLDKTKIDLHLENWAGETHECNLDNDLDDDINGVLWSDYARRRNNSKKKGTVLPPKHISMTSLYPYCDVVTNRAVHNAIPVKRIISRNSPVELTYG